MPTCPNWMRQTAERGQATIMFAVMAVVILLTTGVAVEGGRIFVEYRKMQAAADMAALVGAQDLPTNVSQAQTDACSYAAQNGFDNCTTGGSSQTKVCIPPQSNAPYDFLGHVYGAANPSCAAPTSSGYIETQIRENLGVIPIFNVGVNLYAHAVARHGTPSPRDYALAVLDPSMKGALSFGGSANPAFLMVGPAIINSTNTSAITNGSSKYNPLACNGEWDVVGSEVTPNQSGSPAAGLESNDGTGSVPLFSPPDCYGNGVDTCSSSGVTVPVPTTPDCPVAFYSNSAPIKDPYCSSYSPPTTQTLSISSVNCDGSKTNPVQTMTNCQPCNAGANAGTADSADAWYYQWSVIDSHGNVDRGLDSTTCPTTGPPVSCKAPDPKLGDGWHQVPLTSKFSPSGCCFELFPGYYPNGIDVSQNNSILYFNPGVYTLDVGKASSAGFKISGGAGDNMCVYGAPICDRLSSSSVNIPGTTNNCSTTAFGSSPTATYFSTAAKWYYYCSPWGRWDSNACLGYSGTSACTSSTCPSDTTNCTRPSILASAPTFINGSSTYSSPIPMNGVTFNIIDGAGFKMTGNGNQTLAFPNPCPGTASTATSDSGGNGTQAGDGAVSFGSQSFSGIAGAVTSTGTTASNVYKYPSGSLALIDGATDSGSNWVYPSTDMTVKGECYDPSGSSNTSAGDVWANEFGNQPTQHLHFLVFDRGASSAVTLAGSGNQNWWGVIYDWNNADNGCGNACQVSLAGASGTNGPPLVTGQVIGDNISVTGNSTAEVFYRPCPNAGQCTQGPGSNLIQ